MNFCEQRTEGTLAVWRDPFTCLRAPTMFNLRMDPYERAEITSNTWNDWVIRHSYMVVPMQALVGEFVATFKEFPPRQKPSSFSVDQIMETLQKPQGGWTVYSCDATLARRFVSVRKVRFGSLADMIAALADVCSWGNSRHSWGCASADGDPSLPGSRCGVCGSRTPLSPGVGAF